MAVDRLALELEADREEGHSEHAVGRPPGDRQVEAQRGWAHDDAAERAVLARQDKLAQASATTASAGSKIAPVVSAGSPVGGAGRAGRARPG